MVGRFWRAAVGGALWLVVMAVTGPAHAFEVNLIPQQEVGPNMAFAQRGVFPHLRLHFRDGTSVRTTQERVVDTYLDEERNQARLQGSVRLDVRTEPGSRRVVLLSFNVGGFLQSVGRSLAEVQSVSLHLWQINRGGRSLLPTDRLAVFELPPGATFQGERLNWNEGVRRGLTPSGPVWQPYPPDLKLADLPEVRLVRLEGASSSLQRVFEFRFLDERLTAYVREQTAAGRQTDFIIFGQELPQGPGTDPGPWTNSRMGDFTGSRLANVAIPEILRSRVVRVFFNDDLPVRSRQDLSIIDDTVSAVSSSNTLYIASGSGTSIKIAGYTTSGERVLLHNVGGNCATCPANSVPLVLAVGRDENLFLLIGTNSLLLDTSVNTVYAVTRRGQKIWETPLPVSLITALPGQGFGLSFSPVRGPAPNTFMVKPDGNLFGVFVDTTMPQRGRQGFYEIAAATGALRQAPVPSFLDEVFHVLAARFAADGTMFLVGFQIFLDLPVRVMVFDPDGVEIGRTEFTAVGRVGQIAVDPEGRLRISGDNAGSNLNPNATFITTLTPTEGGVMTIATVTGDRRNLDVGSRPFGMFGTDLAIAPSGTAIGNHITSLPQGNGQAWLPFLTGNQGGFTSQNGFYFQPSFLGNSSTGTGVVSGVGPSVALSGASVLVHNAELGQLITLVDTRTERPPGGFPGGFSGVNDIRPARNGIFMVSEDKLLFLTQGSYDFTISPALVILPACASDQPLNCPRLPRPVSGCTLPVQVDRSTGKPRCHPRDFLSAGSGTIPGTECDFLRGQPGCSREEFVFSVGDELGNELEGLRILSGSGTLREPLPPNRSVASQISHIVVRINPFTVAPTVATVQVTERITLAAAGAEEPVRWDTLSGQSLIEAFSPEGSTLTVTAGARASLQPVVVRATDNAGRFATALLVIDPQPRLRPLNPDPNPKDARGAEVSTIDRGGTVFRYYRLVLSAGGDEDEAAPSDLRARFLVGSGGAEVIAQGVSDVPPPFSETLSDIPNLVAVAVPWSAINAAPNATVNVELADFSSPSLGRTFEVPAAERTRFSIAVKPRTFKNGLSIGETATVSPGVELSAGQGITLTQEDEDALTAGFTKLVVDRATKAGVGFSAGIDGELDLGIATASGTAASAGISASLQGTQQFSFAPPTQFPEVQSLLLASSLSDLVGPFNPAAVFFRSLLGPLAALAAIQGNALQAQTEAGGTVSIAVQGSGPKVDLTVGLVQPNGPEVPPSKLGLNLGAVAAETSVEAALGIKAGFAAGRAKTVSGALGVNGALNLAVASLPGLPACKLSLACAGAGVGAEATLDVTTGAPTLKFTSNEKSPGRSDTKSYTIDDLNAVRRIVSGSPNYLAQLALSILANDRLLQLLADPGAGVDLGISRLTADAVLADPTPMVAGNQLDLIFSLLRSLGDGLRINTEETTTETAQITVPIGARVRLGPATLGIGLSVEGSSAFDFTRRRGAIVGLREFLLQEYDEQDEFIVQQSVLETADAILQNAVDRTAETLVTLRDTVVNGVPAALSNVRRRVRLLFTPVANGAVTVSSWPAAGPSGQSGNARVAAKSLSFVGPAQETFEAIGHVHNIQSDEGALGAGMLELDYTDAELAGADEQQLRIARFDAAAAQFVFLQTTVDTAANRASAAIDRLGQYALFKRLDLGCPSLEAIDAEATLLRLRFTAIHHPAIAGYNVFRATLFDEAFDLLTPTPVAGTAFEDRGIDRNTLYRYRVTGVTSTGGETCASNTRTNDADADGLADQFEVAFGFSTSRDDAGDDPDGDGLINLDEQGLGTDPTRADTDGDGLTDDVEVLQLMTSPTTSDTDGDGLDDGEEVSRGTDPLRADTDGDGLGDGEEVLTFGTDPLRADTDGDGLDDASELVTLRTNPRAFDTDGDGLGDRLEIEVFQTDPTRADTDGDGQDDGAEVDFGSNPLDPASTAAPAGPSVRIEPRSIRAREVTTIVITAEVPEGFGSITGASAQLQGQEVLPLLLHNVEVQGNRARITLANVVVPGGFFGDLVFRLNTTAGTASARLAVEVP